MRFRRLEDLIPQWAEVGGLASNDKMPWLSWGIPIAHCQARRFYLKTPNSICSQCYCKKGRMAFGSSLAAQRRRLNCYLRHRLGWVRSMTTLLNALATFTPSPYFRWFDSGDFYDYEMALDILKVCHATPSINHWISTQDAHLPIHLDGTATPTGVVDQLILNRVVIPFNTTIRCSAHHINPQVINTGSPIRITHAAVETNDRFRLTPAACPAYSRTDANGKTLPTRCGPCRKCWNAAIELVIYPLH